MRAIPAHSAAVQCPNWDSPHPGGPRQIRVDNTLQALTAVIAAGDAAIYTWVMPQGPCNATANVTLSKSNYNALHKGLWRWARQSCSKDRIERTKPLLTKSAKKDTCPCHGLPSASNTAAPRISNPLEHTWLAVAWYGEGEPLYPRTGPPQAYYARVSRP